MYFIVIDHIAEIDKHRAACQEWRLIFVIPALIGKDALTVSESIANISRA